MSKNREITRVSMILAADRLRRQAQEGKHLSPERILEIVGIINEWSKALEFEDALDDVRAALADKPAGKRFWLSWWHPEGGGEIELHSPWWASGYRGDNGRPSICAAVIAEDEAAAKAMIVAAYIVPPDEGAIEWRFVEQRKSGWSPFSDRFCRDEWMVWP